MAQFLPLADKPTLDQAKFTIDEVLAILNAKLDADVSSRQAGVFTQTMANRLDAAVSSRQANWGATTTHRDRIDASISSRASQPSVNTVSNNVGSNSDSSSASGSVHAKLKELRSLVLNSSGGIKVQRGIASTPTIDNDPHIINITISPVVLIKSFVVPATMMMGVGGPSSANFLKANMTLTSTTNLRIELFGGNWLRDKVFAWQIVEFE
ncbi:hypothetical protein Amet_2433 [Alkaliphilus metalliredigens QYMF]|uniref:Uncharacterized protein n=1 Tax=Alkaliphilus metalliredigens (strain QYMF) TaxID=293826 RepID=A6TQW9_ALKMQ|nr:hypothetical protein [Alkaliphilus metalliredigens]ABR48587.1 hypothetical protein Amet_2433 [Alkaliphilus metalliredigens QYMF]